MPCGISPPTLGLHVDLGVPADVQPYSDHRGSANHMCRGKHPARRDQVSRPTQASLPWPSINSDLGNPPRIGRHVSPLTLVIRALVFVLDLLAADQRGRTLPIRTGRRPHVPRTEHKLDVLDRFP